MVTISRVVEKLVNDSPFIQEALAKGIVNYVALAESMQKQVEIEMKEKVKVSAIMMSLRRLNEKFDKTFSGKIKFDKHSDITIKSNLLEFMIRRTPDTQKKIKEIYAFTENKPGTFLTLIQGPNEISVLTSDLYEDKIEELFLKFDIEKKIKNLCGLTIKLPKEFVDTPGFFYFVTRALTLENINMIDMVSTFTELTIIVRENDASRAFEIIRTLVQNNR